MSLSRLKRVALALALAATLFLFDWFLARRLQRVDLGRLMEPLVVPLLQDDQVVLGRPLLRTGEIGEKLLLSGDEPTVRRVALRFTGARLAEPTVTFLEDYLCEPWEDYEPPPQCGAFGELGDVSLAQRSFGPGFESGASDGCRMAISLAWEDGREARLRLWELAGRNPFTRVLSLRPESGSLGVRLDLVTQDPVGPGCRVKAEILGWEGHLSAPLHFELVVPAGRTASIELESTGSWTEGFAGSSLASVVPLHVDRFEVRGCPECDPVVQASSRGEREVRLTELTVLPHGLRVALFGDGWLQGEPQYLPDELEPGTLLRSWRENHPVLNAAWTSFRVFFLGLVTLYLFEKPWTALREWVGSRSNPPEPKSGGKTPEG